MAARRLSLQDRLALIHTSTGSQAALAREVGISHQRIGRLLRAGFPELGGLKDESRAMKDADLVARIEAAYQRHRERTRAQAQRDGIPYREPAVYARRMIDSEGRPTSRLQTGNTHWLSDGLRASWVGALARSRKLYALFVGSRVNLATYLRARLARPATREGRERAKRSRDEIRAAIARGIDQSLMWSRPIPMEFDQPALDQLMRDALARHERAIGEPGTERASKMMMQFDTPAIARREGRKIAGTKTGTKTKGKTDAKTARARATRKGRRT